MFTKMPVQAVEQFGFRIGCIHPLHAAKYLPIAGILGRYIYKEL